MGKHPAFTVPICGNGKALELGAWCLISETFLYLSRVIHLIGRCLIGEVLRYMLIALIDLNPHCKEAIFWFSLSPGQALCVFWVPVPRLVLTERSTCARLMTQSQSMCN